MSAKSDLEQRVQRLEDIEAIKKLKSDYAAAVDTKDLDRIVSLFTSDGVWEGEPYGRHEGHAAIRACMDEPEVPWSLHFMIAPSIEVADDGLSANARWYLWQTATVTDEDGSNPTAIVMLASYQDRCAKVGDTWLFESMTATIHHVTDFDKGWVQQPMRGVEHA